jgi:hypothetical protein
MGNKQSSVQLDPTEIKVPEHFKFVYEKDINGQPHAIFKEYNLDKDQDVITGCLPLVKIKTFSDYPTEIQESILAYVKKMVDDVLAEGKYDYINIFNWKIFRYRIHNNKVYDREEPYQTRQIIQHVVSQFIKQPYILDSNDTVFFVCNIQPTV